MARAHSRAPRRSMGRYFDLKFEAARETVSLVIKHDAQCRNNYMRLRAIELIEVIPESEPETQKLLNQPQLQPRR
jgi:hypothetical protein